MFTTGCTPEDRYESNMVYRWADDGRSYSAIANNQAGEPCVEVHCEYLGKAPQDPLEKPVSRDWKSQNTDFYHYDLLNLTDQTLELMTLSFRLKTGRDGKIYETRNQPAIEEELGGFIIPQNKRLTRRNSWVYGQGQENVLHKIYEAQLGGETLLIDIPLVFKK